MLRWMTRFLQADMEDMADLADMRQVLMERVQGVMETCCEFRSSLHHYSFLYVDDRRELLRQFLLYGHFLTSEEMEVHADDEVPESPPALGDFKEEINKWVLVKQSVSTYLCLLLNFWLFLCSSQP